MDNNINFYPISLNETIKSCILCNQTFCKLAYNKKGRCEKFIEEDKRRWRYFNFKASKPICRKNKGRDLITKNGLWKCKNKFKEGEMLGRKGSKAYSFYQIKEPLKYLHQTDLWSKLNYERQRLECNWELGAVECLYKSVVPADCGKYTPFYANCGKCRGWRNPKLQKFEYLAGTSLKSKEARRNKRRRDHENWLKKQKDRI